MNAMTSDDQTLLVADAEGVVNVFSLLSGERTKTYKSDHASITAIGSTSDASQIVTADNAGVVKLWAPK